MSKHYITFLLLAIVATSAAAQTISPTSVVRLDQQPPRRHGTIAGRQKTSDGTVTSLNWAGYALTNNLFNEVRGSWIIPAVTCDSTGRQFSSYWVGMDGYDTDAVERAGTESDCFFERPYYYVWYEVSPSATVKVTALDVQPGHVMTVSVGRVPGAVNLAITDVTNGKNLNLTIEAEIAASSAEWILEAPATDFRTLPLAQFGTLLIGPLYTFPGGLNCATGNGGCSAITSFPNLQQITMTSRTGAPLAVPSPIAGDGQSFTIMRQ